MEVEVIRSTKEKLRLRINGINYTVANAIRRSSFEILMPAVDEIEVYANDSVLYDEIIANRLCLIPLVPNREINVREECTCKGKGCNKCSLKIKLEAVGKKGGVMVYSSEIKGEAKPLFADIPIVWLEEGQQLKLVGTVTLGKALEHAKYQAGLIVYNPVFILKNFNRAAFNNEEIKKIIEKFNIKLEKNIELDEKQYEILSYIQEKFPDTKLELSLSETDFVFDVETFSYLTPKEIFIKSIEALDKNLEELARSIK